MKSVEQLLVKIFADGADLAGAVAGLIGIALQETMEFSLQMPGNAALFCFSPRWS